MLWIGCEQCDRILNGLFQPVHISCCPYRLCHTKEQSLEEFMNNNFGRVQLNDPFDKQLYWIISFWFCNSQVAENQCATISENPVALVFTAYAYVWKCTRFKHRKTVELIDHFRAICGNKTAWEGKEEFRLSIVHQLTELQLVSGILQSSGGTRQEHFRIWRLFGSCHLIYCLVVSVDRIPPKNEWGI